MFYKNNINNETIIFPKKHFKDLLFIKNFYLIYDKTYNEHNSYYDDEIIDNKLKYNVSYIDHYSNKKITKEIDYVIYDDSYDLFLSHHHIINRKYDNYDDGSLFSYLFNIDSTIYTIENDLKILSKKININDDDNNINQIYQYYQFKNPIRGSYKKD